MAITQTYVDYGAGNDATGDGTIGTPWKTLQWAFDHLTRNTTDGNQVNLKAGTAHVNAAALDLTTFIAGGALAAAAPLIMRGYTSTANDGGIGEIDCGGARLFAEITYTNVFLVSLKMHSFGNNHGIDFSGAATNTHIIGCEISKGVSTPTSKFLIYFVHDVIGCYIHDAGTSGAGIAYPMVLCYGNYIDNCPTGVISPGAEMAYNIIMDCPTIGISCAAATILHNNVIYSSTAATGSGISLSSSTHVLNNIIVGYSGAGGKGISANNIGMHGYNAFYNNATPFSISNQMFIDLTANDVSLAADPFTDAANGDFSLTAAAKAALADKGFPGQYLGAHANTDSHINIGPIQMAASTGGGVNMPRVRVGH